ncbi:STAS/SEC14 domain-containing protein [Pseudonocardia sp. RS11V-5]|uniref:STAS/SEC14 domain-containing protein n=1 Tax=Pseudonocardia terrae TaxID=2905831 RepID=UPI001E4D2BCC|nr:STAS/SEC14 domain-containing protein [Pseudonocardia terrae]MCE3555154.1 STAS/SEC14 domain-containing protein [Pseudonocardia terrae]
MIEKLTDLPDGVVGLRVGGRLTPQDYEDVITPMIDEAVRAGDQLRCLIEIDDDFTGLTPPAVVDDVRLGLRTVGSFDGVAVVTDRSWIRTPTQWAAFMVPFPMRVFPKADRGPAAEWLAALPAGAMMEVALDAATGVVTAEVSEALRIEDFERLAATVDPWMHEHGELPGIVLHVRRVPGWTSLGSLLRHVRFVVGHQGKVERLALATDVPAAEAVASVVGRVMHPEIRAFGYAALETAQVWAAGS